MDFYTRKQLTEKSDEAENRSKYEISLVSTLAVTVTSHNGETLFVSYGYDTNMEGYTTLRADIPKLSAIFVNIILSEERYNETLS